MSTGTLGYIVGKANKKNFSRFFCRIWRQILGKPQHTSCFVSQAALPTTQMFSKRDFFRKKCLFSSFPLLLAVWFGLCTYTQAHTLQGIRTTERGKCWCTHTQAGSAIRETRMSDSRGKKAKKKISRSGSNRAHGSKTRRIINRCLSSPWKLKSEQGMGMSSFYGLSGAQNISTTCLE